MDPNWSRLIPAVAAASLVACGPVVPDERPNIVLLMADDMGWSDVGCYGGEIPTPAIDGLADAGLRFRDFYTNGLCGPTRVSLLYGVYCQQTGHKGWLWHGERDTSTVAALPELLNDSGYRTLLVGKWQGGEHPLDTGFDRFFGPLATGPISYYDEVQPNPFYLDRKRVPLPKDFYLTDALADHAVRFLEESADEAGPFFLYVAFVAPHWPLHAREADVAPFRELYFQLGWERAWAGRLERQRELGLIPADWPEPERPEFIGDWAYDPEPEWQAERMAVYAAQVAGLDRAVGRVLRTLDDLGQADDTLVLFLSDNGAAAKGGQNPDDGNLIEAEGPDWRLDGGPMRHGSGPSVLPGPRDTFAAYGPAWAWVSNAPFRNYKGLAFEGGLRAPLIARFPGSVAAPGTITDQQAHVFDLYATCLDLAGVAHPAGRNPKLDAVDGRSLLPVLRGEPREDPALLAFALKNVGLRRGDWKLVTESRRDPWQLYDLSRDGLETRDLAVEEPERVKAMAAAFMAWRERVDEH